MVPFHAELLSVPKRVHLELGPFWNRSQNFSCELPERFSSSTLRNEARRNSTQGNLKRAIFYHNIFYHNVNLLYRTVPRHHLNEKPIRTHTERFQKATIAIIIKIDYEQNRLDLTIYILYKFNTSTTTPVFQ